MRHQTAMAALAVAVAASLSACGSDDNSSTAARESADGPEIAATTTIVGDLVRQVAGDRASVTVMLTPNTDPHDYEPRPDDAKAVAKAAVVMRSGGDIDTWLGDVVKGVGGERADVSLIKSVKPIEGGEHGHEDEKHEDEKHAGEKGEDVDPHWWQDPTNAIRAVGAIRVALAKADPAGAEVYTANAKRYTEALSRLDQDVAGCMKGIPVAQRKLVTNHEAFGYFADRYGLEVIGTVIPGLSTRSQTSAGEVTELVRTIKRERVRAIFTENTVSGRLEKAIADQASAKVGRPLLSDALAPEGKAGDAYVEMIRANASAIADGLGGDRSACSALG